MDEQLERAQRRRWTTPGAGAALLPAILLALVGACGGGEKSDRAAVAARTTPVRLRVFAAGSLGPLFERLGAKLAPEGITLAVELGPSRSLARRLSELEPPPDLIAVADRTIFDRWSLPRGEIEPYRVFAYEHMVLAHREAAPRIAEARAGRWAEVLLDSGVRFGTAVAAVAPLGYRTRLVWQLAEQHLGVPRLAARLEAACPPAHQRSAVAALVALVQTGALDYAFLYASTARRAGLGVIALGAAIDLGDPRRDRTYAHAQVRLPALDGKGGVTLRGEAIRYAIARTRRGPHPEAAARVLALLAGEPRTLEAWEQHFGDVLNGRSGDRSP